jgi:hypothetical protein
MSTQSFRYRIVHEIKRGYYVLMVFECDNINYFISKNPTTPIGNTLDDLKNKLDQYKEAFKYPILNFEDIRELS